MNITESRAAVAAAEAAFTHAVAKCAAIRFGNLAEWVVTNLITHAAAPARARIAAGAQQLNYAPAADIAGSIHAAIVAAAHDMQAICERIADPETMRGELSRLYREIAPGSMMACPFKLPSEAFQGPVQPTPPAIAYATLQRWRQRGVQVNRVGDNLQLLGVVHDGDLADAAELKEHLLALLPAPVLV